MKRIFSLFIIILCLSVVNSCGTKNSGDTHKIQSEIKKENSSIKFVDKDLSKSYNNCKPGESNCSYIRLKYIEASDGKAKDKINTFIQNLLLYAYDMPDEHSKNPDDMMAIFMRDFETFRKEVPSAPQVWTVDDNIKVYSETEKIICISNEISSYLGGAHPNSVMDFYNMNKETGDTLSLAMLLKPGYETKLNELIDKKYRELKNLKRGDNLAEKGDLFENSIKFNNNFAVTNDKALEFKYNPYEIAPYAIGPITLSISRNDLEDIISPNSFLK